MRMLDFLAKYALVEVITPGSSQYDLDAMVQWCEEHDVPANVCEKVYVFRFLPIAIFQNINLIDGMPYLNSEGTDVARYYFPAFLSRRPDCGWYDCTYRRGLLKT